MSDDDELHHFQFRIERKLPDLFAEIFKVASRWKEGDQNIDIQKAVVGILSALTHLLCALADDLPEPAYEAFLQQVKEGVTHMLNIADSDDPKRELMSCVQALTDTPGETPLTTEVPKGTTKH